MPSVIEKIIELAKDFDDESALFEMVISASDEAFYDEAVQCYGSWDVALIAALKEVLQKKDKRPVAHVVHRDELPFERRRTLEADRPVYVTTSGGSFFYIAGEEFEETTDPERLEIPYGSGVINRIQYVGNPDGVFLVSNKGKVYGLDNRMIPEWMGESDVRGMGAVFPFETDEQIWFILPRKAMYDGRFIHITKQAKGKASDVSQYGRALDREGKEAFLLNDGDEPVAALYGPEDSYVFCASAQGQGIQFNAKADMRSMGRKAVGVNVMKLNPIDDAVIGAFMTRDVEQLVMVTEQGLGKRMWMEEFRPQGRGGAGMQLCRLDTGDRVIGVAPVLPGEDVVISTSLGRTHRFPAHLVDLMGRPAKGNKIIDLAPNETLLGVAVLPCGSTGE